MSESFTTPWTVAHKAPLSMGFPRQEYRNGLPFASPGNIPDPRMESTSPALAGGFFTTKPPGKPMILPSKFNKKTYFESEIVTLNANQRHYFLRCHGTPL